MSKPSGSKDTNETIGSKSSIALFKSDKHREAFDNWIHCICVVTFDLELGQVIEVNKVTDKNFII